MAYKALIPEQRIMLTVGELIDRLQVVADRGHTDLPVMIFSPGQTCMALNAVMLPPVIIDGRTISNLWFDANETHLTAIALYGLKGTE